MAWGRHDFLQFDQTESDILMLDKFR